MDLLRQGTLIPSFVFGARARDAVVGISEGKERNLRAGRYL